MPGRVILADNTAVPNVFVINKATGTETKTDVAGSFSIPARAGDRLAVYSADTEVREFAISEASFTEVPYVLSVEFKGTEMEEVVVNAVTSQSLGLVPKGYKFETAAQRRVQHYTTAAGGLNYLIYAVQGRAFLLKLAVKYAKQEVLTEKIKNIYTEEQLENEFHIPAEYTKGFVFYVAEDAALAAAINANNTGEAKLVITGLAMKYLEIIKNE